MNKDLFEAIYERRSVRKFTEEEIPRATVTRLLEAAAHAPSGGNVQPWKFYAVEDGKTRQDLAGAANQPWMAAAPVVIVVCADLERAAESYGERGRTLYALQDTAAATQNILLAAWGLGLGTCWVGAFSESSVARILKLPEALRPVAMIPVGVAARVPRTPSKRPVEEIVAIIEGGKVID